MGWNGKFIKIQLHYAIIYLRCATAICNDWHVLEYLQQLNRYAIVDLNRLKIIALDLLLFV